MVILCRWWRSTKKRKKSNNIQIYSGVQWPPLIFQLYSAYFEIYSVGLTATNFAALFSSTFFPSLPLYLSIWFDASLPLYLSLLLERCSCLSPPWATLCDCHNPSPPWCTWCKIFLLFCMSNDCHPSKVILIIWFLLWSYTFSKWKKQNEIQW